MYYQEMNSISFKASVQILYIVLCNYCTTCIIYRDKIKFKLTWESVHACILKVFCYLIVWSKILIFMVRLSFYAIPLLIYDFMNDITIIP